MPGSGHAPVRLEPGVVPICLVSMLGTEGTGLGQSHTVEHSDARAGFLTQLACPRGECYLLGFGGRSMEAPHGSCCLLSCVCSLLPWKLCWGRAPGCLRGGCAQRPLPVFKCVQLGAGVSWNPPGGSGATLPVGQVGPVGPASPPSLWRPLEPQSTGQHWAGVVETLLNIFLEGLLCARQCAQSWGYSTEPAKQLLPPYPSLMGHMFCRASLGAQTIKNLSAVQETWV